MKKALLVYIVLLIISISGKAQNLINYSASLFYNSTNNTVQISFFVQNTNNGNGVWVDLAAIQFSLRYNTTYFSMGSFNMIPSGTGLDAPGDSNSDQPDATSTTSVTIGGKNYESLNISRSTNICNNVLRLAPESTIIPVFTVVLNVLAPANYYDFTTPSATNYPAEFQVAGSPTTTFRDILFLATSSADQNGTTNSCTNGNIKLKILSDDPATPTTFTYSNAPLPVKWGGFAIYKQNNKAVLNWETLTEINNSGFEIQRKTTHRFETIAFIPSKAINGNSVEVLNYNFSDPENLMQGTTYYRVLQTGKDNSRSYSEIKSLNNNAKNFQLSIYPNPVTNGRFTIVLPGNTSNFEVQLADNTGRIVKTWNNLMHQQVAIGDVAKGFYLLQVTDKTNGETAVQKIAVQ